MKSSCLRDSPPHNPLGMPDDRKVPCCDGLRSTEVVVTKALVSDSCSDRLSIYEAAKHVGQSAGGAGLGGVGGVEDHGVRGADTDGAAGEWFAGGVPVRAVGDLVTGGGPLAGVVRRVRRGDVVVGGD